MAVWAFNSCFLASFGPWFPFFLVSWDRMDLWGFMYQKGIAKVSLRVALWDWRECGNKRTIPSFARKHEWTNCISRHCKVSLLVVHHIAFHGLEPLSGKKSASQEDSYMKSLAGFSYIIIYIYIVYAYLCVCLHELKDILIFKIYTNFQPNFNGFFPPNETPVCSAKGLISAAVRRPEPLRLSAWKTLCTRTVRPSCPVWQWLHSG